jgi:hypothetical protein
MARKVKTLQAKSSFVVEGDELIAVSVENPAYRVPAEQVEEEPADLYTFEGKPVHVHAGQRFLSNDPLVKDREELFEEVAEGP